ncbi:hypothetical protein PFISCL1PPCAC_18945, partial [Pristionchus fissidentatus]
VRKELKASIQFVRSPLTSKVDLSLISRLIKNCTKLFIRFHCPSLTFEDLIKVHKIILSERSTTRNYFRPSYINLAKELAYRFMGVAVSYFDQTEPPYFPHFYDQNIQIIATDPIEWGAGVQHRNVGTSMMRHKPDRFILNFRLFSD